MAVGHPSALDERSPRWRAGGIAIRSPCSDRTPPTTDATIVVRAFHPAARAVDLRLIATGALLPMTRREPGRPLRGDDRAGDPAHARRRSTTGCASRFPGDHIVEIDDPYRYGRVLTDFDLHLLGEGTHHRAFEKLGAHRITVGTTTGVHFAVWAPNADRVSVDRRLQRVGRPRARRCALLMPNGIWEIFIPDLPDGEKYKFEIRTRTGALLKKTDPFGCRVRGAAADGVDRARHLALPVARRRLDGGAAGARRLARRADVDLRGAPRIVGARARGGQPLPDLSRDGATGWCRT